MPSQLHPADSRPRDWRVPALLLFLAAAPASHVAAQEETEVRGRVADGRGAPVAFANVQIAGSTDGAATDTAGAFRFLTTRTGRQRVRATRIGYRPAEAEVVLVTGRPWS